MDLILTMALLFGGSLALALVLRHAIRRTAFRFMKFEVCVRGRAFTFHRQRFWDERGRPVTDPALLVELEEGWRAIEERTAMEVRH